jgi:putative MFS transporter
LVSYDRRALSNAQPQPKTPLSPYQKRLFFFLSVACFFEGYDFLALAQILPNLRDGFGLSARDGGLLVAVINIGTILAYLLVRKADRWGRRRVLTITIAGYTVCSLLTGLSTNAASFALCQLLARLFLVGECAVSMIYAAEEYPADRRGMVIGTIQACSSLGAITCAGLVPLLLRTPFGWRTVYFVGALPLVLIALARRGLRETARFTAQQQAGTIPQTQLLRIFRTSYRGRMLLLASIWALTYICSNTAILFWKEFAVGERGFSDVQVGTSISIGAVVALPLLFFSGRLLDQIGRRRGALVIFATTSIGVLAVYSLQSQLALTAAMVLAVFGTSAVLQVLNAFTTELFPTELRSDAFAWSNNLLGRTGNVLAPLAVGYAAERIGWGPAVSLTTIGPLLALGLIWFLLPETGGRELEETATLPAAGRR